MMEIQTAVCQDSLRPVPRLFLAALLVMAVLGLTSARHAHADGPGSLDSIPALSSITLNPSQATLNLPLKIVGDPDGTVEGKAQGDPSAQSIFWIGWSDGTEDYLIHTVHNNSDCTGSVCTSESFTVPHTYTSAGSYTIYVLFHGRGYSAQITVKALTQDPPAVAVDAATPLPNCPGGGADCFLQLGVDIYTLTGTITDDDSSSWDLNVNWKDTAAGLSACNPLNNGYAGSFATTQHVTRPGPGLVGFSFQHKYCASSNGLFLRPTVVATDETSKSGSADMPVKGLLVRDTINPELSLSAPGTTILEATGPDGATLPPFNELQITANAIDNDPAAVASCYVGFGTGSQQTVQPGVTKMPLGATVVTCQAHDTANVSTTKTFAVSVQDTTPPALTLPSTSPTAEATGPNGGPVTFSVSAYDLVDGTVSVTCIPASGTTFATGTTLVTCSATDAHGNAASGSFLVTTVDTTPPAIAHHDDVSVPATSGAGANVSYISPATSDLVDGAGTAACIPAVGTFPIGSTTVRCTATDAAHNEATATTFTVNVTAVPVIIGMPASVTIPATSAAGAAYNYSPPTATDYGDASVGTTCTPASGSTFPVGDTIVTCTATGTHGSANASFTVTVGKFSQTIAFTSPIPQAMVGGPTYAPAATATSGLPVTFTIDSASSAICSNSATGVVSFVAVGNCIIDAHQAGNGTYSAAPQVQQTVPVGQSATPPTITLPANIVAYTGNAGGVAVTYPPATAKDSTGASIPVTCTPKSGSNFQVGLTTVTCTATDSSGNRATATFTITVKLVTGDICKKNGWKDFTDPRFKNQGDCVSYFSTHGKNPPAYIDGDHDDSLNNGHDADKTPPVLTVPADIVVYTDNPAGDTVTYSPPTATDDSDPTPTVVCVSSKDGLSSGSVFPVGTTTIKCKATDDSGNVSSDSFTVTVILATHDLCKSGDGWKRFANPGFKDEDDCFDFFDGHDSHGNKDDHWKNGGHSPAYIDGHRFDWSNSDNRAH